MPKISVIVPFFNAEEYFERCIVSLLEQTLDDIEYIFINDCSNDNSIHVLNNTVDRYPHRKPNVIVHNMEVNVGVAKARNWGIKKASGEYIIHCDADDWIDRNLYELLYNKAIQEKADIAVCDYIAWKSSSNNQVVICGKICEKDEFFERILKQHESWSLWNKLVHKSIYQNTNIIEPSGIMGEDAVLVIQYAYLSKKICHCEGSYYYYFFNPNSITKSISEEKVYKKFQESVKNGEQLIKFFKITGLMDKYNKYIDRILFNKKCLLIPNLSKKEYYKMWRSTYSFINYRILYNSEIPLIYRLRHLLLLLGIRV